MIQLPSLPRSRACLVPLLVCLSVGAVWAQPSAERIPAAAVGTGRSSSARGPLPDPALLDGSGKPAEKKSEFGMLGEFELPGDEPARDAQSVDARRPGVLQPESDRGSASSGPVASAPAAQGGDQGRPDGAAGGAAGGEGGQPGAAQANGAPAGATGQGAGKAIAGGGDPAAQAQGIQVGELTGAPAGQAGGGPGGTGQKPAAVALGDKAMRIEPAANAPGVIGSANQKVSENTQQYEKGTGSGGRGPAGVGGGNRAEKGRVVPAGL